MTDRLRDAVASLGAYRTTKNNPPQPDLFSAIQSLADHAGEVLRQELLQTLYEIAQRHATFDVTHLDGLLPPMVDRRLVGWLLKEGQRRGWMTSTGYVSGGASRHGRPVVRWHSNIYRGDNA